MQFGYYVNDTVRHCYSVVGTGFRRVSIWSFYRTNALIDVSLLIVGHIIFFIGRIHLSHFRNGRDFTKIIMALSLTTLLFNIRQPSSRWLFRLLRVALSSGIAVISVVTLHSTLALQSCILDI